MSIDNFNSLINIGEGTYGQVRYSKTDSSKCIKKSDFSYAFIMETSILSALSLHSNLPYIVNTIDIKSNDYYGFITMTRYDTDLNKYVRIYGSISPQKILSIIMKILKGIYYLHQIKIIHRDLKPSNILASDSLNQIVICDFGLSCRIYSSTQYQLKEIQTPSYRAPEVWDEKHYSTKIDMWSIGCIIYYLFFGMDPFNGLKPLESDYLKIIDKISNIKDEKVIHLATNFLNKECDKRYSALEALSYLGIKMPIKLSIGKIKVNKLIEVPVNDIIKEKLAKFPNNVKKSASRIYRSFINEIYNKELFISACIIISIMTIDNDNDLDASDFTSNESDQIIISKYIQIILEKSSYNLFPYLY